MYFETIPKDLTNFSGFITSEDCFQRFIDEFGINGVRWSEPTMLSASYFLRLLCEGSSARARGYGYRNNSENDEHSMQLQPFYRTLLDHGAMWRLSDGSVICTAMPYGDIETIKTAFYQMVSTFSYPASINFEFLDDKFRYRPNGDYMIAIFANEEDYIPGKPLEELKEKAIQYSFPVIRKHYTTSSFVRHKYVSEYAKRRANGICQLCGMPAPFEAWNGEPYLEAHHITPLSEGGPDSIDNIAALCPNCHRKMHQLNLDEDIQFLKDIASKL